MPELQEPPIAPATPARKTWSVGTLTYTAGGLIVLFSWLLWGDFVLQLKERSVPASLQLLLKKFDASDTVNSLLIGVLPQVLGLVLVPIISYRSDRHRGRWGRRIPYMLVPTPVAVLSMVGLAYAPPLGRWMAALSGDTLGANAATLINLGVFWTMFELASIVCDSVFSALIADVVPQRVIGRFYALFRMLSLAAAVVYSWFLMGKIEEHFLPIFLGIGALYGVGFGAMCLFVKEGDYPPPDTVHGRPRSVIEAGKVYFREAFTSTYYGWIFAAITASYVAFQPIILFYIFLGKSLGMSADSIGKTIATPMYICSFAISFPLGWLCDKLHPTRMLMIATATYGIAALVAFTIIPSATLVTVDTFWTQPAQLYLSPDGGAKKFVVMQVICGVLAGVWSTSYNPLVTVLFPKAKFASFLSALNIVRALALIVVGFIAGPILDTLLHHQYRYVYLWGCAFCIVSLSLQWVVYQKFKRLGGVERYVAP
ncbi:MAG: MFS transporter [Tepidisphaeraceae bacterium]